MVNFMKIWEICKTNDIEVLIMEGLNNPTYECNKNANFEQTFQAAFTRIKSKLLKKIQEVLNGSIWEEKQRLQGARTSSLFITSL